MQTLHLARQFRDAVDQPCNLKLKDCLPQAELQISLIEEEFKEVMEAAGAAMLHADDENHQAELLKELVDLKYVIDQFCALVGYDIETAFLRVHRSNMSKFGRDGKAIKNEAGKVIKGPDYQPPVLTDLVGTDAARLGYILGVPCDV